MPIIFKVAWYGVFNCFFSGIYCEAEEKLGVFNRFDREVFPDR